MIAVKYVRLIDVMITFGRDRQAIEKGMDMPKSEAAEADEGLLYKHLARLEEAYAKPVWSQEAAIAGGDSA